MKKNLIYEVMEQEKRIQQYASNPEKLKLEENVSVVISCERPFLYIKAVKGSKNHLIVYNRETCFKAGQKKITGRNSVT